MDNSRNCEAIAKSMNSENETLRKSNRTKTESLSHVDTLTAVIVAADIVDGHTQTLDGEAELRTHRHPVHTVRADSVRTVVVAEVLHDVLHTERQEGNCSSTLCP